MDSESSANLCRYINQKQASQDAATPSEVKTKILEEIKASYTRRGIGNDPGTSLVTDRTVFNIRQDHKCEEGKCQFKKWQREILSLVWERYC